MPKMKNKKAVLKRFKITASGKLKFKKSGTGHNLSHRSRKGKRQKHNPAYVHSADQKLVLECIPYR